MKSFIGLCIAGLILSSFLKYEVQGLSCFCGAAPCELPTCCESGSYTLDACGCCPVCAKGEDQTCGGPFRTSGNCDVGLSCVKKCTCKSEKGLDCIFPFKFKDATYNSCTAVESVNNKTWCATELDEEGVVINGKWDDCDFSCPTEEFKCDGAYFFNTVGRCLNANDAQALQNSQQGTGVNIEEGITKADLAPACKGEEEEEPQCKCSEEPLSSLTGSKNGKPCQSLGNRGFADNGWCFLDNVMDPSNPSKNCYADAQWSQSHGRFWSNLACKPAIIVEGRTSEGEDEYEDYSDEAQIVFDEY
eukprot:TRINITY_DN681_c0_g1_i1.p1 TRINITY_DN681_c0_g1~~TRINITY_DN681_c0_g1_i1.p1  ORF type:complete len:303 (-),score=60.90 TRINITY_DN681_c0_g1_i1:130-1038(-)